jgi:transposase
MDQPTTIKKYHVTLTDDERSQLRDLLSAGKTAARTLTHARILLKADENGEAPALSDEAIRQALDVGLSTVARVRERFVEAGLEAALERRAPRREYQHLVDGECEAHLVALACSAPPEGRRRWTLRLLADKLVEREYIDGISHETVRQVLKKTNLSLG